MKKEYGMVMAFVITMALMFSLVIFAMNAAGDRDVERMKTCVNSGGQWLVVKGQERYTSPSYECVKGN